MTFARIHRLACQRNNLPCAESILKHHVSPEVCLLGHQWISRGFTRYLGKGSIYADSLDTDYPRNEGRLANRFFPRNILWVFLWDPTMKRQYSKYPRIRTNLRTYSLKFGDFQAWKYPRKQFVSVILPEPFQNGCFDKFPVI